MPTRVTSEAISPGTESLAPALAIATISTAEARFERVRRTVGLFLGPLALMALLLWPLDGVSTEAARLTAVMALVVIWWISEAIPIAATALIGTALTVLCGIAPAGQAFAPYASPTIFLFMGSFMIARAIAEHGMDERLAMASVHLPGVAGNLTRVRAVLGMLTLFISGWMSNTATTAMMLPIVVGVLGGVPAVTRRPGPFPVSLLLTVAYAASIGGMMTPVGSPPNLITLGLLEEVGRVRIGFFTWILLVAPIALVYGVVLCFVLPRFVRGSGAAPFLGTFDARRPAGTPWTRGQINCAIAFGVAVTLWVVPGLVVLGADPTSRAAQLAERMDEGVVAIVAAGLLFVLPTDWRQRTFTLDWPAASRIDWGTILLFGGGLSLGQLMFSTGLAAHVGEGIVRFSGAESLWTFTAVATLVALALSEITSNTAATSMLVPVVLSIAAAADLNPVPPAIGTCLGASLAFMFPISTPPNALVYGTGLVPITSMMRYGFAMDMIGFTIIMAGLRLLCPLMGFV
jgi:sodium-dependent dicarboxylate transporter 2/3/5